MIFSDSSFFKSLDGCAGFEKNSFEAAHKLPAPVSIRLNPFKQEANILTSFKQLEPTPIPWCEGGFYLKNRPVFAMDPHWHAGAYYVQEASSMFIDHLVKSVLPNRKDCMALDLCAAPGGKSTLLASMPQFNLVLANEIIHSRIASLMENTTKWGSPHVLVSNNDPLDFEVVPDFFDLILVDAPCSGSGLFRKDPQAFQEWKPELPAFCSSRQKRILQSAVKAIRRDGYLIYSTCSFSECENEENVDYLIDTGDFESVEVDVPLEWGVIQSRSKKHKAAGYRFYPNLLQGEGFFCAVLKKKTGDNCSISDALPGYSSVQPIPVELSSWIFSEHKLHIHQRENEVFAQYATLQNIVSSLDSVLKLKKKSLRLGNIIRGELIPDHELALSILINQNQAQLVLTNEQAIRYLKREELTGFADPNGWYWTTINAIGLGWSKLVSGKLKNHYPMPWRIQKRG